MCKVKFTISDKKLREYFPKEYSTDEMRSVIFALGMIHHIVMPT